MDWVYALVVLHTRKAHGQTGTFGFARNTSQRFAKPKEPIFLPTLGQTNKETTCIYIDQRDKKSDLAIKFYADMNRIKEVLEQKGIKQTWLAEKLGKSYNMVNGYVQNRQQPRLEILFEIAKILEVEVKDLIKEDK